MALFSRTSDFHSVDSSNMPRIFQSTAFLLMSSTAALAQKPIYDIILRNGMVIDGTGSKPFAADIGIRNGYVTRVGDMKSATAPVDLDVAGLIVAPGFINLHSHATPAAAGTAANMLTQGVTTEIVNADGAGNLDITKALNDFGSQGLAVNLGAYVGFNSTWTSVMGRTDRRPSSGDLQMMRDLLTSGLKQGAWGVSAGLDYKPGYFARTEEVIAVVKAAAPWRTNFPNHDRLTPESKYSSLAGHAETMEIGEKAGIMPVITHMKVQGYEQGSAAKAVAAMQASGAVADLYPYLAGQTGLGSLFVPAWAVEGTREDMLRRFADPALRPRIIHDIEDAIKARVLTPDNIDIPSKGRKFTDYMKEMNAGAGETMLRILEKEQPSAIITFGKEEDLIELMRYPGSAISCDCGASEVYPGMHPRYFGTFPRVLGHYVRETNSLTLEDAVRKMTGLPASIAGMIDRGFLAVGMPADITVFDAAKIIDHATYAQPTAVSGGVRHVLVNGQFALLDGAVTGAKNGRKLVRTANMPSRRMSPAQTRSISARGKTYQLNLTQNAGDRRAQGTFRFLDPRSGLETVAQEAGQLQVAGNWATFTARSGDQALQVIVDASNPMNPEPTMRIDFNGEFRLAIKPEQLSIRIK